MWCDPFTEKSKRNTEIFNEMTIMLSLCLLPIFSGGLTDSSEIINGTGYVFIGIVLFNIGVNMLLMIINSTKRVIRVAKRLIFMIKRKWALSKQSTVKTS